jgi:hypothetical protein
MVLAYAGLRISEAFALRLRSVDVDQGLLTVSESLAELGGRHVLDTPKNHQRRVVALPSFVIEALWPLLRELPTGDSLLFTTKRSGRPLHYAAWRQTYFDPAARRTGLAGLTPHALRASHATWVAERHGIMAAAARPRSRQRHHPPLRPHRRRSRRRGDCHPRSSSPGRWGTQGARIGFERDEQGRKRPVSCTNAHARPIVSGVLKTVGAVATPSPGGSNPSPSAPARTWV